jgi:hypothetical protein
VTLGFGFKSYVGYRMRQRKQRVVAKENEFYLQLLQQALPPERLPPAPSSAPTQSLQQQPIVAPVAATSLTDKSKGQSILSHQSYSGTFLNSQISKQYFNKMISTINLFSHKGNILIFNFFFSYIAYFSLQSKVTLILLQCSHPQRGHPIHNQMVMGLIMGIHSRVVRQRITTESPWTKVAQALIQSCLV